MREPIATTPAELQERRRRQTAPAVAARQAKARKRRIDAAAELLREAGWKVNEPDGDKTTP